jgi:hypothetical protein
LERKGEHNNESSIYILQRERALITVITGRTNKQQIHASECVLMRERERDKESYRESKRHYNN